MIPKSWTRAAFVGVVVTAAVMVAYLVFQTFLRVLVTMLLLAAVVTYLLQPLVESIVRFTRAKREHAVRAAAVLLLYVAFVALCYLMGAAITRPLVRDWNELRQTWRTASQHIPAQVVRLGQWYDHNIPAAIRRELEVSLRREMARFPDKYLPGILSGIGRSARTFFRWLAMAVELIFVPIFAFYFLTDFARVREQALFFVPGRHREAVGRYAGGMNSILRGYVRGQVVLCLIAWAVVSVALLIMGVPGALLLGIIAGLARAIPIIGPVVGGIPVLGAVLLDPQWAPAFWWVLIGFTALHLFESKVLMPRVLGYHLDVHPVLVVVSLIVGYELLGLLGMFLAPPAIAIVRFVLAARRREAAESEDQLLLPLAPAPAAEDTPAPA